MRADERFVSLPKNFWANVRTISQAIGYTKRGTGSIHVPTENEISNAYASLNLSTSHLISKPGSWTATGETLIAYFEYRASVLNNIVQHLFMNKNTAEQEFKKLKDSLNPQCPMPMNKQKGEKKNYAFLTCIVNMLVEAAITDSACDYDPRSLTTITEDGHPVRTLSRRVDGAFPSTVNPIAIWEIKEYYYTTTFGSRVADGVYETLLDGMELEELEQSTGCHVEHVLIIDDHFTWWECGRSYLCRMIDMLHMGYVDEVIFGKEVFDRIPALAKQWTKKLATSAP